MAKKETSAVNAPQENGSGLDGEQVLCLGALREQPKVRVLLPRIPGDAMNLPQEVFLNGVPYFIPRGVSVEVPEDIATLLVQAGLL